MEKLSDDQKKVINKIAEENGFEEFEVSVSSGSDKGDNFMGVITKVVIKNDDKRLDLVLKSAFAENGSGKSFMADAMYTHEIYVYEKLLPLYDAIQKELNVKHPFTSYTNIHGSLISEREGFLVMDDLRTNGFKLWDKNVPMNAEHITKVIREFAKIHSLGMIVKYKQPEVFEEIKKSLNMDLSSLGNDTQAEDSPFKKFFEGINALLVSILKDDKRASEVVFPFLQTSEEYNYDVNFKSKYDFTVIHGDCWCNNMMFKYKDSQNQSDPSEVRILDWQVSKTGAPGADLAYYFFTAMDEEHLKNYKYYLKVYYDVLSENLQSAGLDPEQVYSFAMLEEHFRKFSFSSLCPSLIILHILFATKEEIPDIENFDAPEKLISMSISRKSEYEQRVRNIVHFMIDIDAFSN